MKHVFFALFMLLILAGCTKPAAQTAAVSNAAPVSCPDYYYSYNNERVPLKPMPQYITVGFTEKAAALEKKKVMESFREFKGFLAESRTETGTVHIVQLKPDITCAETLRFTNDLKKQASVTYANLVFAAPSSVGADYSWIGITSEFLVTIASPAAEEELNKLVAENNLRIADKLGDTSFMLTADKNAKGSALEMANLFAGKDWVVNAEPNFYFQNQDTPEPAK